jgi:hypothetical protein
MRRTDESGIVAKTGEGIPRHVAGTVPWWPSLTLATICNPILLFHAFRIGDWRVALALMAVFLAPFATVAAYRRRLGQDHTLQWLAVILVLISNCTTFFTASFLQTLPFENLATPGEMQMLLTICYVPFGAMRSLRPDISMTSHRT